MSGQFSAAAEKQKQFAKDKKIGLGHLNAPFQPPPSPPIRSAHLPPSDTLTPWAQRYGASKEPFLAGTGKSGLTPLDLIFKEVHGTAKFRHYLKKYQRHFFGGFDSQGLVDMGAVAHLGLLGDEVRYGVKESDLDAIHPLYQRSQWEVDRPLNFPFHQIGGGIPGYWNAQNDIVWNAIRPAAALASKVISNSHCWPWWDTLIFGKRTLLEFPHDSVLYGDELVNVWPREAVDAAEARRAAQDKFIELSKRLSFGFSSGFIFPGSGMPDDVPWEGISMPSFYNGDTRVFLSTSVCASLLDPTLGVEERLVAQFHVALVLLHETAHAMGYLTDDGLGRRSEMYFMDEINAEMGFSMERAVFGGVFNGIAEFYFWYHMRFSHTFGMCFNDIYPDPTMFGTMPNRNADDPAEIEFRSRYPVPITYVSDVQQESFWRNIVVPYGRDALHPQPLTIGLIHNKNRRDANWAEGHEAKIKTQWDWSKFSNIEDIYDLSDPTSAPFLHLPLVEDREAAATNYIYDAITNDRDFQDEKNERSQRDPRHEWFKKVRLPGETEPAKEFTFLNPSQYNANFRHLTAKPPGFDNLLDHVMALSNVVRFDTLLEWTPIHLCLSYLNNAAASSKRPYPQCNIDDWILFLETSEALSLLFEFRRFGEGVMKVNPDAPEWRAIHAAQAAEKEENEDEDEDLMQDAPEHLVNAWAVLVCVGQLWSEQKVMMRDYGADRVWQTVSTYWTTMHDDDQVGPLISRAAWDECVAWFESNGICFAPAPPGMVRVIRKGWDRKDVPDVVGEVSEYYDLPLNVVKRVNLGEIFGIGATTKRPYCCRYVPVETLPEEGTGSREGKRKRSDDHHVPSGGNERPRKMRKW